MEDLNVKKIHVNDGGGLYDDVGFCGHILTILNDIEVKGAKNLQHMVMAISGIQTLQDSLRKRRDKEEDHDQDHPADENI